MASLDTYTNYFNPQKEELLCYKRKQSRQAQTPL